MIGILNGSTVVKECDFNKPDNDEIEDLLDDNIKGCRIKYLQTIEYRLVYACKCTKNFQDEEVNFTITHRSMEFKTEFYGLNKKIKKARRNGSSFNRINKLTIKVYSSPSNKNIQYYLKFHLTIMNSQFCKIFSQNPDYVKTHRNDLNNPFHFSCPIWLNQ